MEALYVSPNGSDTTGNGTEQAPFRTPSKARDSVRSLLHSGTMMGDIVVYLRGGAYWLTETLALDARDSGRNGYEVVYRAYPGERPMISGGKEISGWVNQGNGVYTANSGGLDFRQLYVNDQRAVRARTPNVGEFFRIQEWDKTNKLFVVDSHDVANFPTLGGNSNVEIVIQTQWSDQHLKVESVVTNGHQASIDTRVHERNTLFGRANPGNDPGASYHVENALEFLDTNAEFYLDRPGNVLYYRPRFGEDMSQAIVVAPQLVTLLNLEGTLNEPASNIRFEGLSFQHSGWNVPTEEGYLNKQATVYEYNAGWERKMPAAVIVKNAQNISFEHNRFERLGGAGLDLVSGTADVRIVGNVFADISGNGMNVESTLPRDRVVPADTRTIVKRTLVSNNYITKIGQDYYGSVAIFAGYPEALTMEHNEIAYVPYSGISLGWGWTSNDTALKNNIVRYNDIHHAMQLMVDGAGIYTLSKQPNSQITENYVHDNVRSPWAAPYVDPTKNHYAVGGIYLDLNSAGFTVARNVIENVPTPLFANRFKYGSNQYIGNDGHDEAVKSNAGLQQEFRSLRNSVHAYDSRQPTLVSAIADPIGRQIVLTFSEAIDPGMLQASGFTLGGASAVVTTAELDTNVPANNAVRLLLSERLPYKQPVTLSLAEAAVRDASWNTNAPLASFEVDTRDVESPYVIHLDITGSPIMTVGDTVYSAPSVYTIEGTPVIPGPAHWQFASANPAIATVDSTGQVRAISAGKTEVTISALVGDIVSVPVATHLDIFVFAAGETVPRLVNIAEKKAVTATGTSAGVNYGPENAVDGTMGTVWALSTEGTLTVDLGDTYALYDIEQVQVATRTDFDQKTPRRNFEVQASNTRDFLTYTVLGGQGDIELPFGGTLDINLTQPQSYRFIRFVKNGGYAVLAELRVNASYRQADSTPQWPMFAKLDAAEEAPGQVRLIWSPPSDFYDITGYRISFNGGAPVTVSGSVYSYLIDNVTEGTPLQATVQAENAYGTSSNGPSVTINPSWSGYYLDLTWDGTPIMLAGENVTLKPLVKNADNRPVKWGASTWQFSSSNTTVATVNSDGVVTALSTGVGGQTQIALSATLNGNTYSSRLDVYVFSASQARPTEVNVARGRETSSNVGYVSPHATTRAVDGLNNTMWATNVPGYLQLDMADSYRYYDIVAIEVVTRQDADLQSPRRNFDIYGSSNSAFTTSTLLASQGATALAFKEIKRYDLAQPGSYPYIRYVKTGNYAEVAELRVWATLKPR
ncbi:right-handed parallel beta-helix repeat-containing protein [Paenibacillus hodogayensis]|uniref:Right-handed parallel beta-helix repeat-containing protein n=1 Tax=Paenibacillus hodogayensis TaxID=279208 RepID=A0ABV5W3J0_9BACL